MNRLLRRTWLPALGLGIFYAVTLAFVMNGPELGWSSESAVTGGVFTLLLLVHPAVTWLVSAFVAYRHGLVWPLIPLAALVFVPTALLILNDSALIYCLLYAVAALFGLVAGVGVRRLQRPATA